MTKVLFLSTSTNNTDTVINSLEYLGNHQVKVFRYDRKWLEACAQAVQQNPQVRDLLMAGAWPPPENREGVRLRVRMDDEMLSEASGFKPDVILYISAWEGLFVPENETLVALNKIAPMVHLCFDASDPPWWPQMAKFEEVGCFSLTVNIDGGHAWPGGRDWSGESISGLTLLTPLDPRAFAGVQVAFNERPFLIGYAGNAGGWIRHGLVERLKNMKGFAFRPRDDHPLSYKNYCDFLRHCRLSISVPFTGSNASKHVKGRVVETGYAGACLLEWKNSATRSWFEPRRDFWEYESVDECQEMAEWLADHPKLCQEMAENLHNRVVQEHSPEKFWSAVFGKLELTSFRPG